MKKNGLVLINSSCYDKTTDEVIDWLIHYNVSFFRVNDMEEVEVRHLFIDNTGISFEFFLVVGVICKKKQNGIF